MNDDTSVIRAVSVSKDAVYLHQVRYCKMTVKDINICVVEREFYALPMQGLPRPVRPVLSR
jgi:hypothetical protein